MFGRRQKESIDRRQGDGNSPTGLERRKRPRRRDLAPILGNTIVLFKEELAQKQLELDEALKAQAEAVADKEELLKKLLIDPVTELPTRRALDEKLPELVEMAHSNNEPLALMFFDANRLHELNEEHGFEAGDRLLKGIAEAIRENARPDDLLVRYGGDEFIKVLHGFKPIEGVSNQELIDDTISREDDALMQHVPRTELQNGLSSGVSYSIAILQPGESWQSLIARGHSATTEKKPKLPRAS